MPVFTLVGLALTALAGLCIHAASPNQRLWPAPWRRWPARVAGGVLLVFGWLALTQDLQRVAAAFTLGTMLMLVLVVLPYAGAIADVRRVR